MKKILNRFLEFTFSKKRAVVFVIAFMLFTVIGTLTHEMGHIAVAKRYKYETQLHYGSMNYYYDGEKEDPDAIKHLKIFKRNFKAIQNNTKFIGQEEYLRLDKLLDERYPEKKNSFFILMGGPLQTIGTCFLGLLLLFYRKSKYKIKFKLLDWLGIFLSLFILREVFNFVGAIYYTIVFSKSNFHGDEFRISKYYGLNEWIIPILTFIFGMIISLYVIFRVLPKKYRLTFIISGFIGGVLGFLIWFGGMGKFLLP